MTSEVNEVKNNNQLFNSQNSRHYQVTDLSCTFGHFWKPLFCPLCLHVSWSMTQGNVCFMTRYLRTSLVFEDNQTQIPLKLGFIILDKYLLWGWLHRTKDWDLTENSKKKCAFWKFLINYMAIKWHYVGSNRLEKKNLEMDHFELLWMTLATGKDLEQVVVYVLLFHLQCERGLSLGENRLKFQKNNKKMWFKLVQVRYILIWLISQAHHNQIDKKGKTIAVQVHLHSHTICDRRSLLNSSWGQWRGWQWLKFKYIDLFLAISNKATKVAAATTEATSAFLSF